jgi:tRNA nucleotidyltransferase/poly(A) polymerase
MAKSTHCVILTDVEKKIFEFLLGVNEKHKLGCTLRVAGGWVRDKILGCESDDIDISLDKLTGQEFSKYVRMEKKVNVHIIEAKHDQCKHLEVATIHLFGIEIDLLNLRSEEYGDTRIPEIKIGNPIEDALRRDLTINSLFYNVNDEKIEDFTGMGLYDIRTKVIRTPLKPNQTFIDDPLRILRAIRFATRLGFTIDESIIKSVSNGKDIHKSLMEKVSQERIITEIEKTIKYDFYKMLKYINQMNIFNAVFRPSTNVNLKDLMIIAEKYSTHISKNIKSYLFWTLIYSLYEDPKSELEKIKLGKKEKTTIIKLLNACNAHQIVWSSAVSYTSSDFDELLGFMIMELKTEELVMDSVDICYFLREDYPESYKEYVKKLKDMMWIADLKPIINGHEIMKRYGAKGKKIANMLDKVIKYQIHHKDCAKDEVFIYLDNTTV